MAGISPEYLKSLLTRREFGKVSVSAAGAIALPLKQETAQTPAPGHRAMIKNINILYRKPELSHDEFIKHWVEIHAPMSHNIPQVRRYVLCPVIPQTTRPNSQEIDGIAEVWFDDWASSQSLADSPEAKKWFADGRTFISHSISVMTEQIVIIP